MEQIAWVSRWFILKKTILSKCSCYRVPRSLLLYNVCFVPSAVARKDWALHLIWSELCWREWTDCREWLTWLEELKWLLTFRLTALFRALCASFHIHSFLLDFCPFILIVLFQSCCSLAQVFGRTLVHEFLFSYSHSGWNLLFLKQTPLWHEATWDKPEASIKTETEEEEEEELCWYDTIDEWYRLLIQFVMFRK